VEGRRLVRKPRIPMIVRGHLSYRSRGLRPGPASEKTARQRIFSLCPAGSSKIDLGKAAEKG
jgi:hypothetical protein